MLERRRGGADRLGLSMGWLQSELTAYRQASQTYDLECRFRQHLPKVEFHEILSCAAEAVRPGGTWIVVGLHIDPAGTGQRLADHGVATEGMMQIDGMAKARRI